jgi:hypothetical protein
MSSVSIVLPAATGSLEEYTLAEPRAWPVSPEPITARRV